MSGQGAARFVPDRPFPRYAFVPGVNPHPVRDPEGHMFGASPRKVAPCAPEAWRSDVEYLFGVDLYHAAFFWEAHEVWEGLWKAAADPIQRDFLQGLIQVAAAVLKIRMEEPDGARKLRDRARERLERVAKQHERYMGVDVPELLAALERLPGAVPELAPD